MKNNKFINQINHIEKFWVGLLEGDGSIVVRKNKQNKVYGSFEISLKYLQTNEHMLKIIALVIGGKIYYEKKQNLIIKLKWIAVSQKDFNNCVNILTKYPLLTSRKICQLQHLNKCLINKNWNYHLKYRLFKYETQITKINMFNKNFSLPFYFNSWLSGFIEAEGCFRFRNNISTSFYISQNNDYYILNAIKQFFNVNHKINIAKDNPTVETHYRISFSGEIFIKKLIIHLIKYPLFGEKKKLFFVWKEKINSVFYEKKSNNITF